MQVQVQEKIKVKYTNTTDKNIILNNTMIKGTKQRCDESDSDFRQRVINHVNHVNHVNQEFIKNCEELR